MTKNYKFGTFYYWEIILLFLFAISAFGRGKGTRSKLSLCREVIDSAYITVDTNNIGFFPNSYYYNECVNMKLLPDSISGNLFIPEQRNDKDEYIIYNSNSAGLINWVLIEFRDSTSFSSFLFSNAFIPCTPIYKNENRWEGTCFLATDSWLNYLSHCPSQTVQMLLNSRKPKIVVELYPAKLHSLSGKRCK